MTNEKQFCDECAENLAVTKCPECGAENLCETCAADCAAWDRSRADDFKIMVEG